MRQRQKINLAAALLISIIFTGAGRLPPRTPAYPSWFYAPPKNSVTATGMARLSHFKESAISQASERALAGLARNIRVRIAGEERSLGLAGRELYLGNTITETVDSSTVGYAESVICYLDTVISDDLVLVLAATGSYACSSEMLQADALPEWTRHIPDQPGYAYGLGAAPVYYTEISSWSEAEQAARRHLALSLMSREKSLGKISHYGLQEARSTETDIVLQNIETVGRARDEQFFYLLIRMRIGR